MKLRKFWAVGIIFLLPEKIHYPSGANNAKLVWYEKTLMGPFQGQKFRYFSFSLWMMLHWGRQPMGSPIFCQNCCKIRLHNINKIKVLGSTT